MNFTDTEITVLKNFARISPSMVIHPDRFEVKSQANTVVGKYEFDKEYDFEAFGIYEVPKFLQAMEAFENPTVTVGSKFVTITQGDQNIKYFTSPLDILPKVPDVEPKFAKVDCELDFDLPAEKLAFIFKTAAILKAEFVFLESDGKAVRVTVANELESSNNAMQSAIRDNVRANKLVGSLRIPVDELKILPGDYTIKASTAGISKWSCFNGVVYYIGVKKM